MIAAVAFDIIQILNLTLALPLNFLVLSNNNDAKWGNEK